MFDSNVYVVVLSLMKSYHLCNTYLYSHSDLGAVGASMSLGSLGD